MSEQPPHYTYRVIAPTFLEDRLNEAWRRGWNVHTFIDGDAESYPAVLFEYVGRIGALGQGPPFADDEGEEP